MGHSWKVTYYDTLEHAVASWGRWAGEEWKLADALQALDLLVARRGPPSLGFGGGMTTETRIAAGHTPIAIPVQRQYVGVTWNGVIGFQLQKGFMRATIQPTPTWQAAHRPPSANGTQAMWWKWPFPDHVEFGKASESSSSRHGNCPCSSWLQQPVGSECSECGELVAQAVEGT